MGTIDKIAAEIANERRRQIGGEGYSRERDDGYTLGDLPMAAAAYASVASAQARGAQAHEFTAAMMLGEGEWPWPAETWKPRDARRNLIRAGALIMAEIERLDRAAETQR